MADQENRRSFFLAGIYGLWGVISAALALPAAFYLLLPPRTRRASEWVDAGDASRLQPGTPEEFVFRRNRVDGWKITSEKSSAWLVKTPEQKVVAYGPSCTHLGCAYHWEEGKRYFLCPCHTSAFSLDGKVVLGPAPRPLDQYAVRVENGKMMIGELKKSEGEA